MTLSVEETRALADTVRARLVLGGTSNPDFDSRAAIRVEAQALRVSNGVAESASEAFLGNELLGLGEIGRAHV